MDVKNYTACCISLSMPQIVSIASKSESEVHNIEGNTVLTEHHNRTTLELGISKITNKLFAKT